MDVHPPKNGIFIGIDPYPSANHPIFDSNETVWWVVLNFNHLEKYMSSSMGRIIYPIYEMENKKWLKPPTSC